MDILEATLKALQSEETVMLATILSTSGGTPASALSKMLVKDRCRVSVGTVGGGCVEGDVLEEAQRLYGQRKAAILTFHLTEDNPESGMLCGGSLDVLIEPITRENASLIASVRSIQDAGEDCIIATHLQGNGQVREKILLHPAGSHGSAQKYLLDKVKGLLASIPADPGEVLEKVSSRMETQRARFLDGELILEPIPGRPALVVFGGGHVSKYLSRAASMAGFRVTVVDDRKEFASIERFPEAVGTLCVQFSEAFQYLTVKPSTYVAIVTRGHRSDEEVLEQALRTPAKYIGMIGSTRKVLRTYENLRQRGVPQEVLSRVHAPIGVDIGAVTAEEIAISVVAELVLVRRGLSGQIREKSEVMKILIPKIGQKVSGNT